MRKTNHQGTFSYPTIKGISKGLFNIYQGKHGGIMLTMNYDGIQLSKDQIEALGIDLSALIGFDEDLYRQIYLATPSTGRHRKTKDTKTHEHTI